jgi:uncharacterized protein (TIGR02466 family)
MAPPRVKAHRIALFETPVVTATIDDAEPMIAALSAAIQKQRVAHPGVQRSNEGGWHSATDMLDWGGPAARTLADAALRTAKRMTAFASGGAESLDWTVAMWANVSPPGALNHLHAHPGNVWAAVFYVDIGDEAGGGALYLEDPRFPMSAMRAPGLHMIGVDGKAQRAQADVDIATGQLVVFPAWLRHGVRRYTGKRDRISIAMNIDVTEKRG